LVEEEATVIDRLARWEPRDRTRYDGYTVGINDGIAKQQIQDDLPAGATANRLADDMARKQATAEAEAARKQATAEAEAARKQAAEAKEAADKHKREAEEAATRAAEAVKRKREVETAAQSKRREMQQMQAQLDKTKKQHEQMQTDLKVRQEEHEARVVQSRIEAMRKQEQLAEVTQKLKAELVQQYEAASTPLPPGRGGDSLSMQIEDGSPAGATRNRQGDHTVRKGAAGEAEAPSKQEQDLDDPEPETPRQPKVVPKCVLVFTASSQ
jgi:colicin import membrane protein